jgi:hypothetical protein
VAAAAVALVVLAGVPFLLARRHSASEAEPDSGSASQPGPAQEARTGQNLGGSRRRQRRRRR